MPTLLISMRFWALAYHVVDTVHEQSSDGMRAWVGQLKRELDNPVHIVGAKAGTESIQRIHDNLPAQRQQLQHTERPVASPAPSQAAVVRT